MTSVLVVGASGYIGLGVCVALRQAGHRVYGVVRNASAAQLLRVHEIIPVVGDMSNPSALLSESFFPSITHIIDAATASFDHIEKFIDAVSLAAQSTRHRNLSYIYTSGVLLYGKQAEGALLTEAHPTVAFEPFAAVQGPRRGIEDRIIHHRVLKGTVVRPGWVYGGNGGHYLDHLWAYDSTSGDYTISGSPSKRWSWIHITDLASAYLHIVNSPSSIVAGEIFNIADSTRAPFNVIKSSAVRAALSNSKGVSIGKEIVKEAAKDPFSQASELSIVISADKLQRMLGWKPKFNFLDGTDLYYEAWRAANEKRKAAESSSSSSSH